MNELRKLDFVIRCYKTVAKTKRQKLRLKEMQEYRQQLHEELVMTDMMVQMDYDMMRI